MHESFVHNTLVFLCSILSVWLLFNFSFSIFGFTHGPYIVSKVLAKGAYELIDYDGIPLSEPRNGLYLKKYYA
jgi:hypothetical protein